MPAPNNIRTATNQMYWIYDGALTFTINALGDYDKISVSIAAGAIIKAYAKINNVPVIDYGADGNPRSWALLAAPTHLNSSDAVHVYARLSKTTDTALIVYPYEYVDIDPGDGYYYIYLGSLSASLIDGVEVSREWTVGGVGISFTNYGELDTYKQINEQSSEVLSRMFILDVNNVIWAQHDLSFIAGARLLLLRMQVLEGTGNVDITSIANSSSIGDAEFAGSDSSIITSAAMVQYSAYREAFLENLFNNRFIRKDQADSTPYKLSMGEAEVTGDAVIGGDATIGGNISVTGNAEVDGNESIGGTLDVQETAHFKGQTNHDNGLQVGHYTGSGVLGTGAQIDKDGNTVVESLTARSFFAAPVYRFNRIEVTEGEQWSTNALGTIENVEVLSATSGRITLHMEDGEEYSSVALMDICRGIYNEMAAGGVTNDDFTYVALTEAPLSPKEAGCYEIDDEEYVLTQDTSPVTGKTYYNRYNSFKAVEVASGSNPSAMGLFELVSGSYVHTSDVSPVEGKDYYEAFETAVLEEDGDVDSCGFRKRYGFFTSYFVITAIEQNGKEHEDDDKGTCIFQYQLRNTSTPHPVKFMKFAQYGNMMDTTRQSSSYESTHPAWYQIVYAGVSTWIVQPENIVQMFGFIKGFTINKRDGSVFTFPDRGLYVDKNIYFGEAVTEIDPATIETLLEEGASYNTWLDNPAETITVDEKGNVIGDLWTEEEDNGNSYIKYRLHTSVSVGKLDQILTLAPDNEDAGMGTYKLYVSSSDCQFIIRNSTIYITGINNVKSNGITPAGFDFDTMRDMKEVKVTIAINCEGRVSITRTFAITVNHVDTSFIVADMVNERSLVSWNTQTLSWVGLPTTYKVNAWHNNEKINVASASNITVSNATLNGTAVTVQVLDSAASTLTGDVGILKSVASGSAQIQIVKLSDDLVDGELRLPTTIEVSFAGETYQKTVDHVMQLASDVNIFSVKPSEDEIVYDKNAGTLSTDTLYCGVECHSSDNKQFTIALASLTNYDLALTYKRFAPNGTAIDQNEQSYTSAGVAMTTSVGSVEFYLRSNDYYHQGQLVDSESVPVLANGVDGIVYELRMSSNQVVQHEDNSRVPSSITIRAYKRQGGENAAAYTGDIILYNASGTVITAYENVSSQTVTMNQAESVFPISVKLAKHGTSPAEILTEGSISLVKDGQQGSTGLTGQIMYPPVEFVRDGNHTYVNNSVGINTIVVTVNGELYYYKCTATYTPTSSSPLPQNDSTHWEQFSRYNNLATDMLLANRGYASVWGAGELWVGAAEKALGVNGWSMTAGAITHNKTGVQLTADGYINDPDGLHLKVGGKIEKNPNLLYNAYFDTLMTTIVDDTTGESYISVNNGGIHGDMVLCLDAQAPGEAITGYMGASIQGYGIPLTKGKYTFSCYSRTVLDSSDDASLLLYLCTTEDLTGYRSVISTLNLPYSEDYSLSSVTIEITGNTTVYFAFRLSLETQSDGQVYLDSVKLEKGQVVTPMCEMSVNDKLLPTGIDIENRTIRFTTDNLICQNNDGEKTMWLDSIGNIATTGNIMSGIRTIGSAADFAKIAYHIGEITLLDCNTVAAAATNKTYNNLNARGFSGSYWSNNTDSWVLDVFRATDIVRFTASLASNINVVLPFYIAKSPSSDEYYVCRTYTNYKTGQDHLITLDEMQQLVGRKFIFLGDNAGQVQFLIPQVNESGSGADKIYTLMNNSAFGNTPFNQYELYTTKGYIFEYQAYNINFGSLGNALCIFPRCIGQVKYLNEVQNDWGS